MRLILFPKVKGLNKNESEKIIILRMISEVYRKYILKY